MVHRIINMMNSELYGETILSEFKVSIVMKVLGHIQEIAYKINHLYLQNSMQMKSQGEEYTCCLGLGKEISDLHVLAKCNLCLCVITVKSQWETS